MLICDNVAQHHCNNVTAEGNKCHHDIIYIQHILTESDTMLYIYGTETHCSLTDIAITFKSKYLVTVDKIKK